MAQATKLQIGGWKLIFMLLITWLTPFSGLGNLIFCWRDRHYRDRAVIALAVAVVASLIPHAVMGGMGWTFSHIFRVVWVGMSAWMTFDAIKVYKLCHAQRGVTGKTVATKFTVSKSKKKAKKSRTR